MPFDWEEYLNIAKVHINEHAHPCPNAKDRCAVSRAYYAAFGATFRYISATRTAPDIGVGGGAHSLLPRWLKCQDDAGLREIGDWLVRLRQPRMRADYDDQEIPRLSEVAYNAVRDSEAVLNAIATNP